MHNVPYIFIHYYWVYYTSDVYVKLHGNSYFYSLLLCSLPVKTFILYTAASHIPIYYRHVNHTDVCLIISGLEINFLEHWPRGPRAPKIWWSSAISGGPVETILGKDISVACQTLLSGILNRRTIILIF